MKRGDVPSTMSGAISPFGAKCPKWNKIECKNGVIGRSFGSNDTCLRALSIFALAYQSS